MAERALEPEDFDLASQLVNSPAGWVKYQAIAKTYKWLQKFKSVVYHKKFDWLEYMVMLMTIITFSIAWIALPYIYQILKLVPPEKLRPKNNN